MWNSFITHTQALPWLYGLVVGSVIFAVFWAIDHLASHNLIAATLRQIFGQIDFAFCLGSHCAQA